jgi:lincosamide nucleotidyltransferase A/C/D/E
VDDVIPVDEAVGLYKLLDERGIRCWVMGGWGVDALIGRVTRPHKDLDVLVHRADMPAYADVALSAGFGRKLEWAENEPITVVGASYDSAFVDVHPDGRELDVHVIDIATTGAVIQFHREPWPLPNDALLGIGMLAGTRVNCVSRAGQLAMHSGYDLPPTHRADVRALRAAW